VANALHLFSLQGRNRTETEYDQLPGCETFDDTGHRFVVNAGSRAPHYHRDFQIRCTKPLKLALIDVAHQENSGEPDHKNSTFGTPPTRTSCTQDASSTTGDGEHRNHPSHCSQAEQIHRRELAAARARNFTSAPKACAASGGPEHAGQSLR
jgi:hypothetical protein